MDLPDEQRNKAVGVAVKVAVPVVQTVVEQRMRKGIMEKQAEKEIEVAEAKAEARERERPAVQTQQTQQAPHTAKDDTSGNAASGATIADLKAGEDCDLCRQLLDAIDNQPIGVRAEAIEEYREFRGAIEEGKSQAEIEQVLRESDTLRPIMEQELMGEGE